MAARAEPSYDPGGTADDERKRAVCLAELTQRALLGQLTAEEQDELRALMAALLPAPPG